MHRSTGFQLPFKTAPLAVSLLAEIKKHDDPEKAKLPVPLQLVELMMLEEDMEVLDSLIEITCCSTMLWLCLRSCEALEDSNRSLTWEDILFQHNGKTLEGILVSVASAIQFSLLSSKNSHGRCTRTLRKCPELPSCAVTLLSKLYLRLFKIRGAPPNPKAHVFSLSNGKMLTREKLALRTKKYFSMCYTHTDLKPEAVMELVSSHSWRRGGASTWSASGMPDQDLARWGRWKSLCFKRYIFQHSDASHNWIEEAAKLTV